MVTPRVVASALATLGAFLLLPACGSPSQPPEDVTARPVAVVYRGPAACDGCPEAVASLLEDRGDFTVEYIGPGEERKVTAEDLRTVLLYVQPGGFDDVDSALQELGPDAAVAITDWVRGGGRYLGFCMGAYLVGSDPGMGLLAPGDTRSYSESADALVDGPESTVIAVDWDGEVRHQYAQDAAVIIESGVAGERVLSRFTNGQVNALVRPVGRGAVGVVGTHPEAQADWFTPEMVGADIDGPDHAQALQLVDALLDVG